MLKTLRDYNFKNKRVFVRCDFNVPLEKGKVSDDFRIQKNLPTIEYLKNQGARIILASHLGRPQEKGGSKNYSLKPVKERLEELLKEKIIFSKKVVGWRARRKVNKLKNGEILLLENLRFEKGEESNDESFAKKLAELADCYVMEAFSVSHRNHASVSLLPKLLPSFAGFLFEKEIEVLSKIVHSPERPLVVIIGGAKIESKIKAIDKFLKIADHILFGGKVADFILRVKGISVGKPWPQYHAVSIIEKMDLTNPKIHLPVDVIASPDASGSVYTRETGVGSVRKDEDVFDIGKETVSTFSEIIKEAGTIFWSGPFGVFENEKFSEGTKKIGEAIGENKKAFKVVGGGDTIRALRKFNLLDKFSFVSTGGGAMLSFLAGEKLPGIEALTREKT